MLELNIYFLYNNRYLVYSSSDDAPSRYLPEINVGHTEKSDRISTMERTVIGSRERSSLLEDQ